MSRTVGRNSEAYCAKSRRHCYDPAKAARSNEDRQGQQTEKDISQERREMKSSRQRQRRAVSASPADELGSEWEVYEVPEASEGRSSTSSRSRKASQTRPVGAIRETS